MRPESTIFLFFSSRVGSILWGCLKTKNKEAHHTEPSVRVPRKHPSNPQKKENAHQHTNLSNDANTWATATRPLRQTGRKEKRQRTCIMCVFFFQTEEGFVSFTIVWSKKMARGAGPHRHRRGGRRFQTSGRAQSAAGWGIRDRTWRDSAHTESCAMMIPPPVRDRA